ncbi:hypothetical protein J5X98_07330 [Leptothermofonsia sichuanensis E412]|uniref:tellurite resistance TerB C-terminal domain-containing protein n=1 Tax=Leptothermofonsia sichuanensis TaxID=2917832 RepID=UPI001CA757E7|nr:tellurite resistance TerB C-terminal domain-containing protein [Leptothermofonsia sichuanensis]QZZ22194.1 hypothetical protein J5X98_07330 [Leptothermofonsia sichuanensis E412]
MLRNRFLLGFVAFSISFSISWASDRNVNKALATGLTTLPAAIIASMLVDRRSHPRLEARIRALQKHIRVLQKRYSEAYQAYAELAAEREQLMLDSTLEQPPVKPPLLPASLAVPSQSPPKKKPISWDLSVPMGRDSAIEVKPYELPTEIQALPNAGSRSESVVVPAHPSSIPLNRVLVEAEAAKRNIEAKLKSLQVELDQLQAQVASRRQTRDGLVQELADLNQQKRGLQAEVAALQPAIDELKQARKALEQSVAEAEAKRQQLEQGVQPLQMALKQLQSQVDTRQEELRRLELQISDRCQQKEDLERQLASLAVQRQSFQAQVAAADLSLVPTNGKSHPAPKKDTSPRHSAKQLNPRSAVTVAASKPEQTTTTQTMSTIAEPAKAEKPSPESSEGWDDLMEQLPEYELQVLRAIVEQNNPAGLIKKIAEDNLTMPEMLIDSINERALETVGDIIIEPGTHSSSVAIAREHLRTVKKLLTQNL